MLQGGPAVGTGATGQTFVRGGYAFNSAHGDVLICDDTTFATSYLAKLGPLGALTVNCMTGDITKIKNVPVAAVWNVVALSQASCGGL